MAWQRSLTVDESRHHFSTSPSCLPNSYGPPVYCQPTVQFRPTSHTTISVKEEPVPYTSQYHFTPCSPIPSSGIHGATSIQAKQAPPKTEGGARTPIYVNLKQFQRILKQRQSRQALEQIAGNGRKSYLPKSRYRHAVNRLRGLGGRFLSATNNAVLGSNRKRKTALNNKNDVGSKRGSE